MVHSAPKVNHRTLTNHVSVDLEGAPTLIDRSKGRFSVGHWIMCRRAGYRKMDKRSKGLSAATWIASGPPADFFEHERTAEAAERVDRQGQVGDRNLDVIGF